jgi:hypothetical protein
MNKSTNPSKASGSRWPKPGRARTALDVAKGVMVGVGALYLATGSALVTVIGAAVAAALGALYLVAR